MKQLKLILGIAPLLAWPFLTITAQEDDEEVYDLSPYEISDDAVRGYATTSSMGASRVAVPITDLAASVITINKNFIEDMVAQDIRDTFNAVAGVNHGNAGTGNQTSQIVSIRGYRVTGAQRDGIPDLLFASSGGFDYNMVERIEIIKGPAGVTYGIHNPGGVINIVSKKPLPVPATTISGRYGDYNTYKFEIDHSGVLGEDGKGGYRVAASYYDTNGVGELPNEGGSLQMINPSFSYRLDGGMKLWAWGALVRDDSNRRMPMAYGFGFNNPASIGKVGIHKNLVPIYSNLWTTLSFVDVDTFELGLEQPFSGDTFDGNFRLILRTAERDADGSRVRGVGQRNYIGAGGEVLTTESRSYNFQPGELQRVTRNASRFDDRGTLTDLDVLAADLNLTFGDKSAGWGEHNVLTYVQLTDTSDFSRNDSWDVSIPALPQSVQDANGWDLGRIEMWPNPTYQPLTKQFMLDNFTSRTVRGTTNASGETFAWGIIDRSYWFDGKIVTAAGVRRDDVENSSRTVREGRDDVIDESIDADYTSNFSILGKIFDNENGQLSAFINYSDTFIPERGIDVRLATFGTKFPNRTVKTEEFGLKLDLLESRYVATVSIFDNTETDVLVGFNDDLAGTITGIPALPGDILGEGYRAPAGERFSDGWDIDLAMNPIDPLNIILSYGELDVKDSDGIGDHAIPEDTFNLLAKWSFEDGPLAGFDVIWQWQKWGRSKLRDQFGVGRGVENFIPGDGVEHLIFGYHQNENWSYRLRINNIYDDVQILPSEFWTAIGAIYERTFTFSVTYRQ
jgi:iron complex outermembrane receptor protein